MRGLSHKALAGIVLALLFWGSSCTWAENPAPAVAPKLNPPHLNVPHVAPGKLPKMDADPNDPAWENAAVVDGMTPSLNPENSQRTPIPTQVRVLWSEKYLYVRFYCQAEEPVYTPEKGRDALLYRGDAVEVFLDPKGDGRQYFEFQANANNDLFDQAIFVTAEKPDYTPEGRLTDEQMAKEWWGILSWNLPNLKSAASSKVIAKFHKGWTVDMAIPAAVTLQRLGQGQFQPMTLRAHLMRYAYPAALVKPNGERSLFAMNWAPVVFGCPHVSAAAMGYLNLLPPEKK